MVKLNGCIFWLNMINYYKNTIVSGKKLTVVLNKNLIVNSFIIKKIIKSKIRYYGDKATDFYEKEIPKAGYDYACLAVIAIDCVFKKDGNYYLQAFLKECEYMGKEKNWLDT